MQLQFLSDTYQFETDTVVTESGEDDDGPYVVTDHTVFYPGGGGQEPDRGMIINESGTSVPILNAFFVNGELRHYLSEKLPNQKRVKIKIDEAYRLQNARLHTAGHLLAAVVYEKLNWPLRPVKGFHYQQGSYIDFESEKEMFTPSDTEIIARAMEEDISLHLPVQVSNSMLEDTSYPDILDLDSFGTPQIESERWETIDGYKAVPCGGTHLKNTGEIKNFAIKQMIYKKGRIRITYQAGEEVDDGDR